MIEFVNYDKSVVVTGDGDFFCLVKYLLKKGKLAGLIILNKYKYSALLRSFSRYLDFLNLQKQNLGIKKRGIISRHKTKR